MDRSQFLKTGVMGAGILLTVPGSILSKHQKEADQLDKSIVEEFVRVSHGQMEKVKPLLEEHPTLLNAAHDWKLGDFETGLGAASHVGDKQLAKYFLEKGAQANIFTAALFGRIEIIKPMLEFSPVTIHAKGPHGLTLLHHAIKGGDDALEVKEYLVSKGAKETHVPLY